MVEQSTNQKKAKRGRPPVKLPKVKVADKAVDVAGTPEDALDYPSRRKQIIRTWNRLLNYSEAQVEDIVKGESDLSPSLLSNIVKLLSEAADQLAKLDKQEKQEEAAKKSGAWTQEDQAAFEQEQGALPTSEIPWTAEDQAEFEREQAGDYGTTHDGSGNQFPDIPTLRLP